MTWVEEMPMRVGTFWYKRASFESEEENPKLEVSAGTGQVSVTGDARV
jgi:hypothetical protein